VSDEIEEAARAALAGGLIVFPTDTVYGIGTRPDDAAAISRLFELKRRPHSLELPVLVSSLHHAERVARFDDIAVRLVEAFWPGAITVVLPRTSESGDWDLGGDRTTIGVRMPRHEVAVAVLERTGPLAVTSANVSGTRTPTGCDELTALFGRGVEVYLCQEAPLTGLPSTVVDLAHGEPRVLRLGTLDEAAIWPVLAEAELPP
jgi:L-threonylcarbamoyladenylate synthase